MVGLLVAILGVAWFAFMRPSTHEYASFTRPDGHYRVVVLRESVWPALMPGQAGDAPAKVLLYDRGGKVLNEAKVDMAQLIDQVDWSDKKARIKLVAEWDLPD